MLPEILPSLFMLAFLYGEPVVQPPAHVVPSQQVQPAPPVGDGFIVSITPKEIKGAVGELIAIKAESGAELVTWKATAGLRILNDDPPDPTRKSILVHAATGGTFAICCSIPFEKGTRSAITLVQIGPPEPPPPPPQPTFQSKLQEAFTADAGTPEQSSKLAALYRRASEKGAAGAATGLVYDPALTTIAPLLAEMQRAVKLLGLPPGSLGKTVRVIQAELDATLPTVAATPLTEAVRDKVAAVFVRVATALGELK